ncbi:MAG: DUF5005 domain-containing protein [Ferruginibacter sp.]
MMKNRMLCIGLLLGPILGSNAQSTSPNKKDTARFKFTVERAEDWTSLFYRTSGWFGADGIFSIPLSGSDKNNNEGNDSTLLLFGDTYIGEVKEGKPLPGNSMVNNTIAYIRGNDPDPSKIHFHYKQAGQGPPESFFVPQTSTTQKPQLFWLGDGFVNKELNDTRYIFGYKVERTGQGVFDFIEPGVSIIAVPKESRPPFSEQRQIETGLNIKNTVTGDGNFGAGILVNTTWAGSPAADGFVYVYGCTGKDKNLVVARVKPAHFEALNEWRYWNGKEWSKSMKELKAVTNGASNELSMTCLPDGRFLLIFQVMGLSDKVGMRIAASPVGPFSDIIEIYTTPEWKEGIWTYNAKAHPNLSKPGELLISYNTITADFWNDIQKNAHIYRPRFIKLKFE